MDSFRKLPKMKTDIACYKEGGYVSRKKDKDDDHEDVAMDKAVVKKAVGQHESAKHKGEDKTELKLKKGGRAKKDAGSVRKYKTGGVANPMKTGGLSNPMKKGGSCHKEGGAISMKMDAADKKKIAQVKKTKAGKADAPSAGAKKAPGKGVTNMADGGMAPDNMSGQGAVTDAERAEMARALQQGAMMPGALGRRRRPMQTLNMGVLGQGAGQAAQAGGAQALGAAQASQPMGAATKTGPMGAAAPMGTEQDILRGLQAVGQYMGGGSVY
jgi:hypothetical protein